MQCVEFESRLNRVLDSRLSPDDDGQLAEHARECDDCSSLMQAQRALFAGLRAGRAAVPVDLADRVVSRRHTEVTRSRARWRNAGWTVLLATAASLAGLAVIAWSNRNPQPSIVKTPEAPQQKNAGAGRGLAIATIGPKRGTETRNDETPKAADKFDAYFVVLENFASQISDSKEFDEVSESLEPGIKPIRSSFELALDALRRTLPHGRERPSKPDAGASFLPELPSVG